MNRKKISAVLTALLCMTICCCLVVAEDDSIISQEISSAEIQFIENAGQAHEDILYQVKSAKFSFDFTRDSLIVSGPVEDCEECGEAGISPLIVTLEGVNDDATIEALEQLPGYANFLFGSNESDWQQYVPWFGGVRYNDVLPGISLTYTGKDGVLKREFEVSPGSEPGSIKLVYEGADGISIEEDGSLLVKTSFGNLFELAPYSFQDIDGERITVESAYILNEDGSVGYTIGEYDPAYTLIIDPYLEYSTLLGGSLEDYGMDIARDSSGNVYVTGFTSSCNFPLINPILPTPPANFNGTYCHNSRDVFVTKIGVNQTGNATILFSTYLGGNHADFGRGIAVDSLNNMYICGDTFSEDFPRVYPFAYGERLHGSNDAFVLKLHSSGGIILWSSLLGGNFADQANAIALDSLNAVYIAGQTVGNSPYKKLEEVFPTTPNAYQTSPNPNAVMGDGFAAKVSPDGKRLEYSTYIGGAGQDYATGIAVDGQGMAYVTGTTTSTNLLPAGVPGYQKTLKGGQDAFLFKMNFQAGVPPLYATYLGGSSGYDYGEAVAVDSAGSAYVTGATASLNFPVTNMAMQTVKGWQYDAFEKDAFVTKFSSDGTSLIYSTYLGGTMDDWGYGIAVDDTGRAFVTGYSRSSQIPRSGLVSSIKPASGGQDGFLTLISSDGRRAEFSTLFGGYRDDVSRAVAIAPDGNSSFVTGYTSSPTLMNLVTGQNCGDMCFPVYKWINQNVYGPRTYVGGNFTGDFRGSFDAFVMKFGQPTLTPSFTADPVCGYPDSNGNLTVGFTDTTTGTGNILNRLWNFGDGTPIRDSGTSTVISHNYTDPGTYLATLTIQTYTDTMVSNPRPITYCHGQMSANYTVAGYNNTADPIDVPINTPITFNGWAKNFTPTAYEWYFADGTANQTGQSTIHTFSQQGTYRVNMTAVSDTCCFASGNLVGSRLVRVVAPPYAEFTGLPLSGCVPHTVTFTDTSPTTATHGPPTAWQWNFGDNTNIVTVQNPTHTYLHAGTYTVSLTASNIAGSDKFTRTGYIIVNDNGTAGFVGTPRADTAPFEVQFTDKSTGSPVNWRWDFGDGSSVFEGANPDIYKNPKHTYQTSGTYSVSLTVDSSCGGTASANYTNYITANPNMTPRLLFGNNTFATMSGNPVNGTSVLNVTFLANSSDGSLIDQAVWNFGDGNTTTQTRGWGWPLDNLWFNLSHKYYTIGDYTPVITISNTSDGSGTSGGLYTDWIGVYSPLVVNITAIPETGVAGQPILLVDNSEGDPVDWRWSFGDGTPSVSGVSSTTHSYASSGVKTVTLEVWNRYGKTAYGERYVTIGTPSGTGVVNFVPQNITMLTGNTNYRVINLLLDRADYGLSSFTVKVDLNSTARARIRNWAVQPAWVDQFTYAVSPTFDSITLSGIKTSGLIPPGSRNVSLGNISLLGVTQGDANITLNATSTAQYGASFMSLTGVPGDIHVYSIGPLPGYTNPPGDLWPAGIHDGLIDDFDGNGAVNTADVTAFFNAKAGGALVGLPVAPFDYNQNGRIDDHDIIVFFNRYWG